MIRNLNKPPYNEPAFGRALGDAFGNAFGPAGGAQPFTPADVPNLICWYDAALGISFGTGMDVAAWADQSGNGNDLLQATQTNQPLLVAGTPPFVRFNGSDNFIETLAFSSALTQPNTIIMVYSLPSIINNGIIYSGRLLNDRNQLQPNSGKTGYFAGAFTTSPASPGPINTRRLHMAVFNVANSKSFYEGVPDAIVGSVGTQTLSGLCLASFAGGSGQFANVDMFEILVYDSEPTDAQKNLIGNYEANKFGLTWTDI